MNTADRNLIRMILPPLLGIGLAVVLTHPLDPVAGDNTARPPGAVTPAHTDRDTP